MGEIESRSTLLQSCCYSCCGNCCFFSHYSSGCVDKAMDPSEAHPGNPRIKLTEYLKHLALWLGPSPLIFKKGIYKFLIKIVFAGEKLTTSGKKVHLSFIDRCIIELLTPLGVEAEEIYEKTGQLPNPASADDAVLQIVLSVIRDGLVAHPKRYHKMKETLVGVSEETTTNVNWINQIQSDQTLPYRAINVNDSVTKSKFDNLNVCPLFPGLKMAIPGYGDVGKGCAAATIQAGSYNMATMSDPNSARQVIKKWFPDLTLKDAVSEADIKVNHMKKMDNGHFVNGIAKRGLGLGLGLDPGVKVHVSPKHLDEKVAAVPLGKLGAKLDISVRATDVPGDGDVGKGCAAVTNQPGSYIMAIVSDPISASQAIKKGVQDWILVYAVSEADIKVNNMNKMKDNGHFVDGIDMRGLGLGLDPGVKVHVWPKHLDEKVAAAPLGKLGAKLAKLSKEQPHYISFLAA